MKKLLGNIREKLRIRPKDKPELFSFKLEDELKHIRHKVHDGRNYARRDLAQEERHLQKMATVFFDIVQTDSFHKNQFEHFREALENGAGGVWETAVDRITELSYHFVECRVELEELLLSGDLRSKLRAIHSIRPDLFGASKEVEIVDTLLNDSRVSVRREMVNTLTIERMKCHKNLLAERLKLEKDQKTIEAINFAFEYFENPSDVW